MSQKRRKNSRTPILTPQHVDVEGTPALSDISPRDKPWDRHRANADTVSHHYLADGMDRYAERVTSCSQLLDFRLVPDSKQSGMRLKLSSAFFCRVRHCPVCQWRRSLRWRAKAMKALPRLIEEQPKLRYLFLTLTLKNCPVHELRSSLDHINYAFRKLSRRKAFPGVGWLKSVEVTQGRDRLTAHPHQHILLAVKPSYFSHGYLSQQKWCDLWQKCLKVDYQPILHLKAIKPHSSLNIILNEVIKYQVKESDLIMDPAWFAEMVRQMHGTRAISIGGIFRDYFKELEEEPEDLIGQDEEADTDEVDEGHLFFSWRKQERLYRMLNR